MKGLSISLIRQFIAKVSWVTVLLLAGCATSSQSSSEISPQPTHSQATPSAVSTPTPVSATAKPSPLALKLIPAPDNWRENTHIHGMGVSPDNPEMLYLATHHGLFVRSQPGKWSWIGDERDDLMGFVTDPVNPRRFYSSGHPKTGGNLGFRISEDQGQTWKLVSMAGADFHALAIAASNPDMLYGWASTATGKHGFFASEDGGKTWTEPKLNGLAAPPFSIKVHPTNPQQVFATTESGMFVSSDRGDNWTLVSGTANTPIAGLAATSSKAGTTLYGYHFSPKTPGLYRSQDAGKSWESVGKNLEGMILYVAIAPSNPQILYAANEKNNIFQSQDGGVTWTTFN